MRQHQNQHQHPVSCPLTMSADHTQPWLDQHEVLSGDLYLLTAAADCSNARNNNSSKHTTNSSSNSSSRSNSSNHHHHNTNNTYNTNNKRARGGSCSSVRCPVHVQIYRSCFGHYAVVSASLRAPASFLNLRSCNARPCPDPHSHSQSRSSSPSPSLPPSPPPSPPSSPSSSSLPSSSPPSFSYSSTSPFCDRQKRPQRFRVELGGGEGQVIYFEVSPPSSARGEGEGEHYVGVDQWIRAFQGCGVPSPGNIAPSLSPVIPRNPIMPPLQESIEEEEEEE